MKKQIKNIAIIILISVLINMTMPCTVKATWEEIEGMAKEFIDKGNGRRKHSKYW